MILDKSQMTEEDIKLNYITPAILAHWQNKVTMETRITDGRVNIKGNLVTRERPKKADYILWLNRDKPIAVVEAKDNNHPVSYGLQQAITYAQMLDVPFAYSSNGDGFREHDFLTGQERDLALDEFPSPDELTARWEQNANGGAGISDDEKTIINQPYYSSQNTYDPRYYQRNAVNRTVEAIAKGQNRLLLVMATGTGKTYTAFQIVYRLLKSGLKKKVLYLADRNILVDQSIQQDFSPLKKTIHKINFAKDDPVTITSHEVYFSLYQQLTGNEDKEEETEDAAERFAQLFQKDFFDLIIVDECHRGSAKKDSNWRKILEYFSSATQIGMTATPKETKYISNIDYFGEPVYTYSLREGIDDGFLAPFKVYNIHTNIGEGWRPYKGQTDKNGNLIEDRIYNNNDYDYNIIIEDRIYEVANEITEYLKATDRMQKTIVFCANENHAQNMRDALAELNADMCKENPDYVVRITGSDVYGKSKLDYFISVREKYPVIATTSKLLSTGADCKMTKLIVLDEMISSLTEFKQIIGRGTRLREKDGKSHFVVMDFRNVTRLFADPDWDGPIEMVEGYDPNAKKTLKEPKELSDKPPTDTPPTGARVVPIVDSSGCRVEIIGKSVSVYKKKKKRVIAELLREQGIDLEAMKAEQNMSDVDDFDFICHVAFDKKPLTRKERAEGVKKRDFLSKYSGVAREILEALLDRYMNTGIYEIEKTEILQLDPFRKFGKPSKIASYFGGKEGYKKAIKELEAELYKAG